MNVLFIVNTFPVNNNSSSGVFNLRAAKSLDKLNSLQIIHLRGWLPGRPLKRQVSVYGFHVLQVFLPFYDRFHPLLTLLQLSIGKLILWQVLKKEIQEVEMIHSVGASLAGVLSAFISKKTDCPHIAQCIGSDVNVDLPSLSKYLKNWTSNVSMFTTNSLDLQKSVYRLYPEARVQTIYRGIDVDLFKPIPIKRNDHVKFLFIGGICDRGVGSYHRDLKGAITLLQSIERLMMRTGKFKVYLGGPCSSDYPEFTRQVEEHVQVVGSLSQQEIIVWMQNVDCVLIPSRLEGLPNVAVEASSCGTTIIGCDTGGMSEIVQDKITGFLIPTGDNEQLADRMKDIIDNKNLSMEMGARARNFVLEKFRDSSFVREYNELYNSLAIR